MKKYRLIKEYPGSPGLNTIVEKIKNSGSSFYKIENANTAVLDYHVEDSPEFWEEIVEKDYEILKTCPIEGTTYSVKRLSDGEVFTVGDKVKVYEYGSIKTITEIVVNDSKALVKQGIWLRYDSGSSHMTHAIKVENPIFLTHDGKDIFEGDLVWYVNKEDFNYDYFQTHANVTFRSDINAHFLTKEEAKKYIIENKPALSIKEFWEITTMSGSNRVKSLVLEQLVRKRLNLK
jgi:hypothetical protein